MISSNFGNVKRNMVRAPKTTFKSSKRKKTVNARGMLKAS